MLQRFICRLFIILTISSVALPAGAQQASGANDAAIENELRNLISGQRALSACPDMLEDWELDVITLRIQELLFRLNNSTELPPSAARGLLWQGAQFSCDDPNLAAFAKDFRKSALIAWLVSYETLMAAPLCTGPIPNRDYNALKAFNNAITSADYLQGQGLQPLSNAELKDINDAAQNLALSVELACDLTDAVPSTWNDIVRRAMTPVRADTTLEDGGDRSRDFDFLQGFTIGAEASHNVNNRRTVATGVRRSGAPFVKVPKGMCGGRPAGATHLLGSVRCNVILTPDGLLTATISGSETELRLDNAEFQVIDLNSGQVLNRLAANVTYSNADFTPRAATIEFVGALDLIRASIGTTSQLHISLDLSMKKDGSILELQEPTSVFFPGSMETIAAIDVIGAADYAFGPEETDLSLLNHQIRTAQ